MFITFEGVEGCGKSSVLEYCLDKLKSEGFSNIVSTREPGGVKIAEQIRNILLDVENTSMDKRTEVLLFASSRRQHLIEKVWPALKENKIVICDRFLDSSLAYQGGGNQLGVDEVLNVNLFATEQTFPDLTILFDLDPSVGLARINKNANREVNRLDLKDLEYYNRIRNTYLQLSKKYKERYVVIDANKSFEEVANEVLDILRSKINGCI